VRLAVRDQLRHEVDPGWKRRGCARPDGQPVLNIDLLKEPDQGAGGRVVTFEWVKGHAGHALNERADHLARAAATAYRDGLVVPRPRFVAGSAPRCRSRSGRRNGNRKAGPLQRADVPVSLSVGSLAGSRGRRRDDVWLWSGAAHRQGSHETGSRKLCTPTTWRTNGGAIRRAVGPRSCRVLPGAVELTVWTRRWRATCAAEVRFRRCRRGTLSRRVAARRQRLASPSIKEGLNRALRTSGNVRVRRAVVRGRNRVVELEPARGRRGKCVRHEVERLAWTPRRRAGGRGAGCSRVTTRDQVSADRAHGYIEIVPDPAVQMVARLDIDAEAEVATVWRCTGGAETTTYWMPIGERSP